MLGLFLMWALPISTKFLMEALPEADLITNALDLFSFVFATPALFSLEIRERLLASYLEILKFYTRGYAGNRQTSLNYFFGSVLFLLTIAMLYLTLKLSYNNGVLLLEMAKMLDTLQKNWFTSYMVESMNNTQSSLAVIDLFLYALILAYLVFTSSVILANSLVSRISKEQVNKILLSIAVIVFIYSRAIAMIDAIKA